MKRFLANLTWVIFALPFYVTSLLMCAYAFIILITVGHVFDKTKPYSIVDKIDSYIYKQVKEYLAE